MSEQKSIADTSVELFKLLESYSTEERQRIIQAAVILLGDNTVPAGQPSTKMPFVGVSDVTEGAQAFFAEKNPKNKGEELAVAARYLELTAGSEEHSKADIKAVFAEARRNFDDKNFGRDIDNARRQSGLFNLGTGRDANKLSYQGQQFVDALPDRDAASKHKKKKTKTAKKKASAKTSKK
ncbi:hypothetical protein H6783_01520 [Candidatus Nomurabacteria bacterium]|nr:hypothetical protein [Candidatus Nomurabacteria bacterium]